MFFYVYFYIMEISLHSFEYTSQLHSSQSEILYVDVLNGMMSYCDVNRP